VVAPVARTAFTSVCIPAAWKPTPSRSRRRASRSCRRAVLLVVRVRLVVELEDRGVLPLNALATLDQNAGA